MHRRMLLAAGLASPALAQSDPARLVVAFPPGAANDAIARLLADAAGRSGIGATVVENRAGATGNIAAAFVARARPDGRTLLTTLDATFTVNPHVYPSLGFEPAALEPVALLGHFPLALLAHPAAGITDLAGFIAAARARSLLYATAGTVRDPALPEVPTLAEAGLPGFDVRFAFGLWAPRGTPDAARAPWLALAREVFTAQAARITALGVAPEAGDAAALSGWVQAQTPRWAEVAREARMRVE